MLAYFILIVNVMLAVVNAVFCSTLVCAAALIKLLMPTRRLKLKATKFANRGMWLWATGNAKILSFTNRAQWQIQGAENLNAQGWHLLISNHLSWTDIVVLLCVFKDAIPIPKFFLKQQLLYVPFIGMACWALDMPFMRRYSREYLLRHPDKRGQDLATTRRSCEKFRDTPTTIVNFVEGTRFTDDKQRRSRGDFTHVLAPKSGGIAYTLAAMGDQFDSILNVTIAYPDNRARPFYDLLRGKMARIVVQVEVLPVNESVRGDYFHDKRFKRQFQLWLAEVWQRKDRQLTQIYAPSTLANRDTDPHDSQAA
ncbi:acyltransferase [Vibrio sp. SM6]|uniref:Acyltransferase n=1 Tax=Vibrio agarilyticus TaxID=2726741 RepID=A0A7X8YI85_9VIBR|nr:acyltransferase [Vibrio agarilyticus]NLS14350.1 acyltransferase [Vibrio agarilyticus]